MDLIWIFIKYKCEYSSNINERWEISNLYDKLSSNDSKKYLMIFNLSKFQNKVKEWYKVINSWIWRDFIEWLNDMIIEKLILHTNFGVEGNW